MSAMLVPAPGGAPARERNLLVVDDDHLQMLLVTSMARRCGFVVDGAMSLEDAIQRIHTRDYGTVTLDLSLGEHDGVELVRHIAEAGQTPNLLVISGFDQRIRDGALRYAQSMGLNTLGTLRKPINFVEVRRALQAAAKAASAPNAGPGGCPPRVEADDLRRALDKGEIVPVYQPKVDVTTGRIKGVEALARWHSPTLGAVPPTLFVPIVEQSGLSEALTDAMMHAALRDAASWRRTARHVGVAVNVPASALVDVAWPDRVEAALATAGLPADVLTVEITETVATSESALITDILTRLRIKGCHLSLDDFGTGYSSLLTLLRLPFSELKLDRSFVQNCDHDPYALKIVKAMLSLARSFGMRTVAEGVETASVVAVLHEARCDLAQGYFYARPMTADSLMALLAADHTPGALAKQGVSA